MSKNKYKTNLNQSETDAEIKSAETEIDSAEISAVEDVIEVDNISVFQNEPMIENGDLTQINKNVTTLDDIDDKIESKSEKEIRIAKAVEEAKEEMKFCKLDKKRDDKLKNLSFYLALPFLIFSILISLFVKGKSVLYPLGLVFLLLAIAVMVIMTVYRIKNMKVCTCSLCDTQVKTLKSQIIYYSIGGVVLAAIFIVRMFIIYKGA